LLLIKNIKGMMMKISLVHLTPLVALMASACASSKIDNLNAFQKVPMQQSANMPTKTALISSKSRVIIFGLDDKKWSGAGDDVTNKVIKELNSTNNVVIVDRTLAAQLGQEIQLAETKGRTGYKGQDVADFAITGKITDGAAEIKYTASSSYKDKNGKIHITPARCTTSGSAAFSLKIVQLPSLTVIKTIDVEGTASTTQDADSGWGRSHCVGLDQATANGIVSAAMSSAMRKARVELKNQFAPSGYVTERRRFDKTNIFKTTLGAPDGAIQALGVEIIRFSTEPNPLTGENNIEQQSVAQGVISDQIGSNFSFVIISDTEEADKILLGDKVQVKYF
jgi:curli biogenesis system outer membrane secretion channel CsgG